MEFISGFLLGVFVTWVGLLVRVIVVRSKRVRLADTFKSKEKGEQGL